MNDKSNKINVASSRNLYKSNVKVMKVKSEILKQQEEYMEVEQALVDLIRDLDFLIEKVLEVVVAFDGFEIDISEVPLSRYVECKGQLLRAFDKTSLIKSLIDDNILEQLNQFNKDFDIDSKIESSLESELDAKWDNIIDYINENINGVTAKHDSPTNDLIRIIKDDGTEWIL